MLPHLLTGAAHGARLLAVGACLCGLMSGCQSAGQSGGADYAVPQHASAPQYPQPSGPVHYDEHFVPEHRALSPAPEPAPAPVPNDSNGVTVPVPRSAGAMLENRISRQSISTRTQRPVARPASTNRFGHTPVETASRKSNPAQEQVFDLDAPPPTRNSSVRSEQFRRGQEQVSVGESWSDSSAPNSSQNSERTNTSGPALPGINSPGWHHDSPSPQGPRWQSVPAADRHDEPLDLTPESASRHSSGMTAVSGAETGPALSVVKSDLKLNARSVGGLQIPRSMLCEAIRGYRDVEAVENGIVSPGQSVLLYIELEGLTPGPVESGSRTESMTNLTFVAWNGITLGQLNLGRSVGSNTKATAGYFVCHQFDVPVDYPEGEYDLVIEVRDSLGQASAQTRIPVKVAYCN